MANATMGCHSSGMSFDADPASPDKMVETKKKTTKVNIAMVIGVLVFFVVGIVALLMIARR